MEDAAEALLMAGNVLIFLIALTVCISSFSTLRAGIDDIIGQTETVQLAQGTDGYINYIQSRDNGAVRIVGPETVVSSMYRANKEDYVVYIKLKNLGTFNTNLYTANKELKVQDANGHEKTVIQSNDKIIKVIIGKENNKQIEEIYGKIKDLRFCEYLGEYQEDSETNTEDKKINRVITYIDTKCLE